MKLFKGMAAFTLAATMALIPVAANAEELPELERYASYSGKVVGIEPREGVDSVIVKVENDGEIVNFVVGEDTAVLFESGIEGKEVICFYDGSAPVILIYPPQYQAEAIVEKGLAASVKYSTFDNNYLSEDDELKLNVSEDTEVVTPDGERFNGDFRGRRVLVLYDVTTRSIPPQTAPKLIVVLPEKAEPAPEPEEPESEANPLGTLSDDDVLIKLRAAVEGAGLELTWNAEENKVGVGKNIVLKIGSPDAEVNGMRVSMSAAPQIVNGSTYVPLDFFTGVLAMSIE